MLAHRRKTLECEGIIGKSRDPENRRRNIYRLTDKGVELGPIVAEMMGCGAGHDPMTKAPPRAAKKIKTDRKGFPADMRARLKWH